MARIWTSCFSGIGRLVEFRQYLSKVQQGDRLIGPTMDEAKRDFARINTGCLLSPGLP